MARRAGVFYTGVRARKVMELYGFSPYDIDEFLNELPSECRRPWLVVLDDTTNEVDQLHHRFRKVVMRLCDGLESHNLSALKAFGSTRLNLLRVAKDIRYMIGLGNLRTFIQEQYLLHPYRRIPTGEYILTLANISADLDLSLFDVFKTTARRFQTWHDEVDRPDRIFEDPDLLPQGVFERSLLQIKRCTGATNQNCHLCDSLYTFPVDTEKTMTPSPRSAIRTPCNHEFCYDCLQKWRREAIKGRFRCPMCRLCLACGKADCKLHKVNEEPTRPYPFKDFWRIHFNGHRARNTPFYGVTVSNIRRVREMTRAFRVEYASFYEKKLDPLTSHKEKENAEKRLVSITKDISEMIGIIVGNLRSESSADEDRGDEATEENEID